MKHGSTEWYDIKYVVEKLEDALALLDKHNEDLADELHDLIEKIDETLEADE